MKFRKIIAGMLACAVVGGTLPAVDTVFSDYAISASAEEEYTEGTYGVLSYINYGDYIEISGCDTSATEVEIPAEIDGAPVTNIGDSGFYGCTDLTSITIPDSVTSIGWDAFSYCASLTSITIPKSVTSIGTSAFLGCKSLTSVTISNGVEEISGYAFNYCDSLTSITIPDSVSSIGECAFNSCKNLQSVTILNPECNLYVWGFTGEDFEAYYSHGTFSNIDIHAGLDVNQVAHYTGTIYGYENSTAQEYAEFCGYNFVSLGEAPVKVIYGDANDNGTVEVADAVYILQGIADPSNEEYALTDAGKVNADCHNAGNGVDAEDALAIQQFKADIVTAFPVNS